MRRIVSLLVTQHLLWAVSRWNWQRRLTRLATVERTPIRRKLLQPVRS